MTVTVIKNKPLGRLQSFRNRLSEKSEKRSITTKKDIAELDSLLIDLIYPDVDEDYQRAINDLYRLQQDIASSNLPYSELLVKRLEFIINRLDLNKRESVNEV